MRLSPNRGERPSPILTVLVDVSSSMPVRDGREQVPLYMKLGSHHFVEVATSAEVRPCESSLPSSTDMAQSDHEFVYTPLDPSKREVRLLTICKQHDSEACIDCKIATFALSEAPEYDAVSYVWGDPDLNAEIAIDKLRLKVTTSLIDVLTTLRNRTDCAWIWVDAVCINQIDTEEKNHQVPLMRHIYRSAGRVLSWLGSATSDTPLAFALIERWGDAIMSTDPTDQTWSDSAARRCAVANIERPLDAQEWAAFITLTKNRYWERMWILQEVTLARRCILLWGNHEVLFEKLMWAYRAWTTGNLQSLEVAARVAPAGEGTPFYSFMNIPLEGGGFTKVKVDPSAQRELREFPFTLKRTSILSATDPRDKIYGVLGLLDLAGGVFQVNYQGDAISTYRDTFMMLMGTTGRIDLLSFAGSLETGTQDNAPSFWPSWLPDFASSNKRDMNDRFAESSRYYNMFFFNASREVQAQCWIDAEHPGLLHVRGMLLDKVVELTSVFPRTRGRERFCAWLEFFASHVHCIKPRSVSPLQALFRIMIADHLWRGHGTPDFLAPHLGVNFFRFAAGFLQAIQEQIDETEEPWRALTDEARKILTTWIYRDVSQSTWEASSPLPIQTRRFVEPAILRWPESVDVNSELTRSPYLSEFRQVFGRTGPRRLFITAHGYLGAGPANARPGDRVFLPLGCSVPLIVRSCGQKYTVVADAFISGTMQGELFNGSSSFADVTLQ